MSTVTIAVDLAKNVFEIAVTGRAGTIKERKRLSRPQFEQFWGPRAPCRVVMEACATSHFWARSLIARGFEVTLLPPHYVKPYRRRSKTDRADCEAILEADRCAGIHPVAVKSEDQQALVALHRVRSQWIATRTARINGMRALLREFGVAVPLGSKRFMNDLHRLLACWFGLTPREFSSGSRRRLGRISKQGDPYVRMLLIHGARSALNAARRAAQADKPLTQLQAWALHRAGEMHSNKVAVALANKLARIAWAVWHHERTFNGNHVQRVAA